jgi:hypothetical protein
MIDLNAIPRAASIDFLEHFQDRDVCLHDIIEWINECPDIYPEQVISAERLRWWAESEGWTKPE